MPGLLTLAGVLACTPTATILPSPPGSHEVQAKALNERGDVVGFVDGRAALWKHGGHPVNLGVKRGFVASEAYAVNHRRVVYGLLYDKRERAFPFRWRHGRMSLLRDPHGHLRQAMTPDRNALNARGQIAGTLLVRGRARAVRWSPTGKASFLPRLPGHAQAFAWSINPEGLVSGWSRRLPSDDGENNPVIWSASGEVAALPTAPGRADGAAEQTNRSGLTVGYLGTLGTKADPESDQAAVWTAPGAQPLLLGSAEPLAYGELVDVNEHGQAAGMTGRFTKTGFPLAKPAIWQPGWTSLHLLPVPARSRRANPVVVTQLQDINDRGTIAGNVYGLSGRSFDKVRHIDPVVWRLGESRAKCASGSSTSTRTRAPGSSSAPSTGS